MNNNNNINEAADDDSINNNERSTFLKYGLAAMINEYNSLENIDHKKEYLNALTEWYMREKTNIEYLYNNK